MDLKFVILSGANFNHIQKHFVVPLNFKIYAGPLYRVLIAGKTENVEFQGRTIDKGCVDQIELKKY